MNSEFIFPFEKLEIWHLAVDLADFILNILDSSPRNKYSRLIGQMEAAVSSIPQNIAEGKGRQYNKEFIQFLYIAEGSLFEVLTLTEILKRRKLFKEKESMEAHNIPLVMLGAGLLWFGWFGFNAGSALTAGGLASSAFVATNTAGAAAAFTWMLLSWIYRRPTALGTVTGAVIGLAAVTPAAGFVSPIMGIPIGVGAAFIGYYSMLLRGKSRVDDSLDVLACHGMGGIWGVLATGIFASLAVNSAGADGLIFGNFAQIGKQLVAIVSVGVFAFAGTLILGKLVDVTIGLRVTPTEENLGLDISQHGEKAYGGLGR